MFPFSLFIYFYFPNSLRNLVEFLNFDFFILYELDSLATKKDIEVKNQSIIGTTANLVHNKISLLNQYTNRSAHFWTNALSVKSEGYKK